MKKLGILWVLLSVLLMGCQSEEKDLRDMNHTVTFVGFGMEETYTLSELYELPLQQTDSTRLTSTGETIVSKIKGVDVSYFLEKMGKSMNDVGSVRLIATDGYLAEVPRELLAQSKLFVVLEEDGKFLDHEDQIVKSGLIDQRSLYWVRLLSRVEFTEPLPQRSFTQWFFAEPLIDSLETFDFDVYIYKEKAVYLLDILDKIEDDSEVVVMTAVDGLTKVERRPDLVNTVIVLSGEGNPMFTAKDIGKGREFKSMITLDTLSSRVIFTGSLTKSFILESLLGEDMNELVLVGDRTVTVNPKNTECEFVMDVITCEFDSQTINNVIRMSRP